MKLSKLISVFALIAASVSAFAAAPGKIAVNSVDGNVSVAVSGAKKQVAVGDFLSEKSTISTTADSTAKLVLGNGTVIALKPNTTIEISQFVQNKPEAVEGLDFSTFSAEPQETFGSRTVVRLVGGTAVFDVAKLLTSSSLEVVTRAGEITVKGTTFSVADNGTHVSVSVVDGNVSVAPTGRAAVTVSSGRSVTVSAAGASVGTPVYGGVSLTQEREIREAVAETRTTGTTTGERTVSGDAPEIGIDPEIPAYAQEGAGVAGPDAGRLNSASSL